MGSAANPLNIVGAGLAVGAALGMAGSFVSQPDLQTVLWASMLLAW
jgi:hypothetical protein